MNAKLLIFNIITLLTIAVAFLRGQGAGPLDPPAAPADGVYRTLEEIYDAVKAAESSVDPRTPIHSVPFVISQPGSYYLPNNLTASLGSGQAAISITCSSVTLDLNGFAIQSSPGSSGYGILIQGAEGSPPMGITVRNGSLVGNSEVENSDDVWTVNPDGFESGIHAEGIVLGIRLVDLNISKCRGDGVGVASLELGPVFTAFTSVPRPFSAVRCIALGNGGGGLSLPEGSTVSDCMAHLNASVGIWATTVSNSTASVNGNRGIRAAVVANCQAYRNKTHGIQASVVRGSKAIANYGNGIAGGTVSQVHTSWNTESGVWALDASISLSTAEDNDLDDFRLGSSTRSGNYPAP